MEEKKIIKLSKKNINCENLEKAKKILKNNYEVSYGRYSPTELRKALNQKSPLFIQNHLIIGYEDGEFIDSNDEKIAIEKMVKAVIVEDEIETEEDYNEDLRDKFVIIGKNEWNGNVGEFSSLLDLRVGEIFLPPHSLIFNFIKPSESQIKEKIVSMLSGVNVNIYSSDNCVDNGLHEIGHAFWRDCVKPEEREMFKKIWKREKVSAIYEYAWERMDEEEMFCTIYKLYLKSLLINKSFLNILEFEEPEGLNLLQKVLERKVKQKMVNDIWELNKHKIDLLLNPKFDKTTGRFIVKQGLREEMKNIELPQQVAQNLNRVVGGIPFINMNKAIVPVKKNKIDWHNIKRSTAVEKELKKARGRKKTIIYVDMDGVVADFNKKYKELFNRDSQKDDSFTGFQFISTRPDFFLHLPVIEKGKELVENLVQKYEVVFLTTPMRDIETCKIDKYNWIKRNFGKFDVIFEKDKHKYVVDDQSILIDDRKENLEKWAEAGGTAIKFPQKIETILKKIETTIGDKMIVYSMDVENDPTEKQKKSGLYKKGKINFKGLNIRIENPKGSIRWGFDEDGKKWVSKMKAHYGYIVGTEGNDYDPVDVFLGDKSNASRAFVVNQNDENNMFDEHKIILAVDNVDEARKLYLSNYTKGWESRIHSIVQTNTRKIREWLTEGSAREPFK